MVEERYGWLVESDKTRIMSRKVVYIGSRDLVPAFIREA